MSFSPDDLSLVGNSLIGCDLTAPAVPQRVRPNPPLMSRLLHLHRAAEQLGKGTRDILSNTEVGRALEQALMHAMIACLAEDARAQISFSSRHHSAIIARFEELLAANSNRPLYLAEICATVGASETTLRVSCHEHLGMGPLRYLWLSWDCPRTVQDW
jgi:hypothetical protein